MGTLSVTELNRRKDEVFDRLAELRTKDADEGLTDDESREVDTLITEANDIGPKIARAKNLEASLSEYDKNKQARGSVARKQARFTEGDGREQRGDDEPKDARAMIREFFDGDEMESLRRSGGKGMAGFELGSFWDMRSVVGAPEQRALAQTGDLPASYLQPQRIPGIQRGADLFGSLRDVLNVGVTNSDSIVYFKETGFTNAAAAVGEATATADTSGTKPESALTFDEDTANVKTIAHWIPITRQLLWNAPEFESYVSGRLVDGLRLEENDQLLNGDGTGQNLTGLLQTSGVQTLDSNGTTGYFDTNPVANAGTANENYERILRARTLISTVGRARANFVVLNPTDHETFLASTDANRQYFGMGPFSGAPIPTLWGLRVVENENIAAGTALVGDGRQATIWDRMAATVTTGTIDKQFIRNMLTLLAEERVALTVFRPTAFAAVTLA